MAIDIDPIRAYSSQPIAASKKDAGAKEAETVQKDKGAAGAVEAPRDKGVAAAGATKDAAAAAVVQEGGAAAVAGAGFRSTMDFSPDAFALRQNEQLGFAFAGIVSGGGFDFRPRMHESYGSSSAGWSDSFSSNRIDDDIYGVSQSGQGAKSNLANSPEAMLALKDLLSGNSSMSYDDMAKNLKEKYGIFAEAGDIKVKDKDGKEITVKGVKLGNGDYFIDGNGNGVGDMADYKFDDAIKNLKEKYNLSDEDLKSIVGGLKGNAGIGGGNGQGFGAQGVFGGRNFSALNELDQYPPAFQGLLRSLYGGQGYGMQNPMMGMGGMQNGFPMPMYDPMRNYDWITLFLMALQYAA